MDQALWISALSIGFLGSAHCVAMCGPLALALPVSRKSKLHSSIGILVYHIGKLTMYVLLGLIFGSLGKGLVLAGMQQRVSIIAGILILIAVLIPSLKHKNNAVIGFIYRRILNPVQAEMAKLLKQHRLPALLLIGFFNGLLPCGLIYLALMGALSTGSLPQGALFMLAFGLGTIPALASLQLASQLTQSKIPAKIRSIFPILMIFAALFFILRGAGLDIPYISPANGVLTFGSEACY